MSGRTRGILFATFALLATFVGLRPDAATAANEHANWHAEARPGPKVVTREAPGRSPTGSATTDPGTATQASPGPAALATTPTSTFEVTYDSDFDANPSAKNAFQAAVDTWSRIVVSSIPIRINAEFNNLPSGVLGQAGPHLLRDFGAGVPGVWYPQAMAEAITNHDFTEGADYEIEAEFSSNPTTGFYFGTDGNPASTQIDFESVVMHELGHGLGHIDFLFYGSDCPGAPNQGCYKAGPMIYDTFTRTVGGTRLTSMASPSTQLGTAVTTPGGVIFDGPATNATGAPATLHTPAEYESGSSLGHLDNRYDLSADSLMTPSLSRGEAARPRQIVIAMLKDMGFPVATGALYQPTQPTRLLDTRTSGTPIAGGASVNLRVTGVGGVPASGVEAVVLNVTATEPSASSYFTVWPAGATRPLASNLNFEPGETVPNAVIAKVGASGAVSIFNSSGSAHAVVDLNGWFPSGTTYAPLAPTRILDTRNTSSPLGPNSTRELTVIGGAVPAGATAVVLNVTATAPTLGSYLTVWPTGDTRPTASNLNFATNETVPNLVLAKVGTGGKISMYNLAGNVHVVVDVQGYLSSTTDIVPLTPSRLIDTRTAGTPIGPGGTLELTIAGRGGVPTYGVAAVVLNVTATESNASSFYTVWPKGLPRPTASSLNFVPGQNVPNLVVAKVGNNGKINIYNATGSAHVVVDVMGYSY